MTKDCPLKSLSLSSFLLLAYVATCHGFAPTCTKRVAPRVSLGLKRQFSQNEQADRVRHLSALENESLDLSGRLECLLLPMSSLIDETTGGWGLSYADLSPENHETPTGVIFLATNLAYSVVGVLLGLHGDPLLGLLTECASVASFGYHFTQLQLGPDKPTVRLALLIDYIFAGAALMTGGIYVALAPLDVPLEGFGACALGVACLGASWKWERGMPYIVFHGLWHLFGAYGGYLIGQAHLAGSMAA
jgi:hypothetical protein